MMKKEEDSSICVSIDFNKMSCTHFDDGLDVGNVRWARDLF